MTSAAATAAPQPEHALTLSQMWVLLYAEERAVRSGGLLVGEKLRPSDLDSLQTLNDAGLLAFGPIPARALAQIVHPGPNLHYTHWVTMHETGWALAGQIRRISASALSPAREKVDAVLQEMALDAQLARGVAHA